MILNNLAVYMKYFELFGGSFTDYTNTNSASSLLVANFADGDVIKNTSGASFNSLTIGGYGTSSYYNRQPFFNFYYSFCAITKQTSIQLDYMNIGFGTGTTPVTVNDYCLENLISTLTIPSGNMSKTINFTVSEDGKTVTRTVKVTVSPKNNGSENVTVGEVGFFQQVFDGQYPAIGKPVLMHRIVFDEPVTIEAGATGTFTFEFTFTNSIA